MHFIAVKNVFLHPKKSYNILIVKFDNNKPCKIVSHNNYD